MLPSSSLNSYFPIPLERTNTFCEFTLSQSDRSVCLSSQFCTRRILKFQYLHSLSKRMMWHVHTWMPAPNPKGICHLDVLCVGQVSKQRRWDFWLYRNTLCNSSLLFWCFLHWVCSLRRLQSLQILNFHCKDAINTFSNIFTSVDLPYKGILTCHFVISSSYSHASITQINIFLNCSLLHIHSAQDENKSWIRTNQAKVSKLSKQRVLS